MSARVPRRRSVRGYRFAFGPGWVLFHLFAWGAAVAMVFLGRWQLDVSESKHFSLQNFGYSIQWWLFSGFALFFWWRVLRDATRRRAESVLDRVGAVGSQASSPAPAESAPAVQPPVAYRRYVMPTAPQPADDDPVHAAYNAYLAGLAAQDAQERSR